MIINVGRVMLPNHLTIPAFKVSGLDSCNHREISQFYSEIYAHWMRLANDHADAIPFQINTHKKEITVSVQQPKSIALSLIATYLRDLIQSLYTSRFSKKMIVVLNLELNDMIQQFDPAGLQVLQKMQRKSSPFTHLMHI